MKSLFFALSILLPVMASASQDSDDIDAIRKAFESKQLSEKELTPIGFRKAAEAKGDLNASISMSMGSWSAGGCTQKWRNEKLGFRLIGLTITDVDRSCACGTTTDINFLTGLEIYDTDRDGNGEQMEKAKETKTRKKRKAVLWENFNYEEMCQSG